jgi:hypothetical protein
LPKGQAGAAGAVVLLDKPETPALCFRSSKDALDFARDGLKKGNRNWVWHKIDFAESYENGDIEIVIKVAIRGHPGNYHLVFFAIPSREMNSKTGPTQMMDGHPATASPDGDESGMCSVTELVQGPNGVIPSFVRLERSKKRHDIRRQVFASTPNVVLHVRGSIPKRKLGVLGLGDAARTAAAYPVWSSADRRASRASAA